VGTVELITRRVFTAVLDSQLREQHTRWPGSGSAEREGAKQGIEDRTIPECENGLLMIDGTLVPIFKWPYYFG
jgi:hypothetical protein